VGGAAGMAHAVAPIMAQEPFGAIAAIPQAKRESRRRACAVMAALDDGRMKRKAAAGVRGRRRDR